MQTEARVEGTEIANGATIIVSCKVDERADKGPELHRTACGKRGEVKASLFTEELTVQVLQPKSDNEKSFIKRQIRTMKAMSRAVWYIKTNGTPVPEGVDSIVNGLVLVVNYKEDEEQTKDLSYTVQHVVNGEVKDTLTEELTGAGTAAGYAGRETKCLKQTGNTEGYVEERSGICRRKRSGRHGDSERCSNHSKL
ncbi:MAG: hypothetical protein ACLRZZ_06655 [Enterocloster sp.]